MKKSAVINYNGLRVSLDTVATYKGIWVSEKIGTDRFGIKFSLRSGAILKTLGDDKVARDKVLAHLDAHFKPVNFTSNLCQVCAIRIEKDGYCNVDGCDEWNGYEMFERKPDAELSSNI